MFVQGMKLACVMLYAEEEKEVWYTAVDKRRHYPHSHAKSITVHMVAGHSCNVPWAKVVLMDDTVKLVNLLNCDEVELLEKEGA